MTNIPAVFPASEAARFCGLSPSTLAKLRLGGNGPIYLKLGRRVVYRRDDLAAWLETRIARDTATSLAERETLRGKVQCIYFDPPYAGGNPDIAHGKLCAERMMRLIKATDGG